MVKYVLLVNQLRCCMCGKVQDPPKREGPGIYHAGAQDPVIPDLPQGHWRVTGRHCFCPDCWELHHTATFTKMPPDISTFQGWYYALMHLAAGAGWACALAATSEWDLRDEFELGVTPKDCFDEITNYAAGEC